MLGEWKDLTDEELDQCIEKARTIAASHVIKVLQNITAPFDYHAGLFARNDWVPEDEIFTHYRMPLQFVEWPEQDIECTSAYYLSPNGYYLVQYSDQGMSYSVFKMDHLGEIHGKCWRWSPKFKWYQKAKYDHGNFIEGTKYDLYFDGTTHKLIVGERTTMSVGDIPELPY